MRTESFAWMACFAAVTVALPEASTKSSLQTMLLPPALETASEPPPFTVRSDLEKTAPSIALSSAAA